MREAGAEAAREVEARGAGVGDEERGHGEVEFIGKIAGQEFAQDPRTAFDQDTQYASFGQIDEDEIEGERVTGVDEYGAVRPAAPGRGRSRGWRSTPGGARPGRRNEPAGPGRRWR